MTMLQGPLTSLQRMLHAPVTTSPAAGNKADNAAPPPASDGWQQAMLLDLLSVIRSRLHDPALLKLIDDYALLLQIGEQNPLPPPQIFALPDVLDAGLIAARSLQPPGPHVHVTASIPSSMPLHWQGQAERLEVLCRHLLLIGLRRTQTGLVRLRLEAGMSTMTAHRPGDDRPDILRLRLEDSGPPVQHGQMQNWLNGHNDDQAPAAALNPARQDVSWKLVGRLFNQLGGAATAENMAAGGVRIEGWLPMTPVTDEMPLSPAEPPDSLRRLLYGPPPLALLVETATGPQNVAAILRDAGCSVFCVRDHLAALAWAPLLPCSLIVIDITIPDARLSVMRGLRHLVDSRLMRDIPVWAIASSLNLSERERWLNAGVEEIMLLPLHPVRLSRACAKLPPAPPLFYRVYDEKLREELPASAALRLPEMNADLAARLLAIREELAAMATKPPSAARPAVSSFHAIKSIALSLGYFRLAALMSAIEEALAAKLFRQSPKNWLVIRDYLCPENCDFPAPPPPTITDEGMSPVKGYKL